MNTLLQKSVLGFLFFCVDSSNASILTSKVKGTSKVTKKTKNNTKEMSEAEMLKQVNVMIFLVETMLPKTTEEFKKTDLKQFENNPKIQQKDFSGLMLAASPELTKVLNHEIDSSQAKTKESEFTHLKLMHKLLNFMLKLSAAKELREKDLVNSKTKLAEILKTWSNMNKKNISNEINSIITEAKIYMQKPNTDPQYILNLILFITYFETELTYLEVTNYIKNKK